MKRLIFASISLIFISIYAFAQIALDYQRYVQEIEQKWNISELKKFEAFQKQQDAALQKFQRQEKEAYRRYVEEIEKKWNHFIGPTKQQWVEYSEDKDTRIIVNFDEKETPENNQGNEKPEGDEGGKKPEDNKGQIMVETLIPADQPDGLSRAKEQLAKQIEKVFSPKNEAKTNLLEGQVKTEAGETVTSQNVRQFVEEEVLLEAKVDPQPIRSKDGVNRVKVSVTIPMVPEHLRIRAEKYLESVKKYSKQHEVDVPLVLAIIETASDFNPMAKSPIPAFGLMQLVPQSEGREAYNYVFKEDKVPSPSFLYVPDNNLLLGTAYLHLLKESYLYGIKDPQKQEYLLIAAYNGSIGEVIKRVLKKYNVPKMSPSEIYDVLMREMPDETKDYLAKVTSRKKKYLALL